MLKIMVLRKRHEKMLEEAEQLRSKISGFKSREADVAAQVEAASTDEEIAAAAAAVEELEKAQKSAKERLATIIEEAEALQQEIADAEAAASSAAGGDGGEDGGDEGEARSRRSMSPDFRRRCQDFQRTGKHTYRNAKSFVTRTAVLSSSTGVIGPTGVSGINDPVLSKNAVDAVLASTLNTTFALTGAAGSALFTPHLLSDIILAYGGDEGVEGAATLVLNKADLKAFASVRGTNEYLPVYSIIPDSANPSSGVIKDNNGLSCRYCLNKNVTALSSLTPTTTAKKTMFYGNPQCCEMGLWGGVEIDVNDGYKFGEGLLTIRGEVMADQDVTVPNGFVVVTAKSA